MPAAGASVRNQLAGGLSKRLPAWLADNSLSEVAEIAKTRLYSVTVKIEEKPPSLSGCLFVCLSVYLFVCLPARRSAAALGNQLNWQGYLLEASCSARDFHSRFSWMRN